MKLASALTFASLAVSAFAASIYIGSPTPNTTIIPGDDITVQVIRPDTLEGAVYAGMGIGMQQCSNATGCIPQSEILGAIVFLGPYSPQFPSSDTPNNQPQQNFSVQVPTDFQPGSTVILSVTLLSFIAAEGMPYLDEVNVTLTVGASD